MRQVTVPAQITSVEDTIVGSITTRQLLVFAVIVTVCGYLIYLLFPPFLQMTILKLIIILFVLSVSLLLIYRPSGIVASSLNAVIFKQGEIVFEDKTVLDHFSLLFQYCFLRPKVYLMNLTGCLPKRLLQRPKIDRTRTITTRLIESGEIKGVFDPRAYPVMLETQGRITAVLKMDNKEPYRLEGEEGKNYYVTFK